LCRLRQPVRPLDLSLWIPLCSIPQVLLCSAHVSLVRSNLSLRVRLLLVLTLDSGLKLRLVSPWLDRFLELNLCPMFCPHWLVQFRGCSGLPLGLNLPDLSLESTGQHSQVWFLPVLFLELLCSAFRSLFPPVRCPLWPAHCPGSSPPTPCPYSLPERCDPHRLVGTILLNSRNLKALARPSRGLARVSRQRPNPVWFPCPELAWLNLGFLMQRSFLESHLANWSA
jgi:hypothetical protein